MHGLDKKLCQIKLLRNAYCHHTICIWREKGCIDRFRNPSATLVPFRTKRRNDFKCLHSPAISTHMRLPASRSCSWRPRSRSRPRTSRRRRHRAASPPGRRGIRRGAGSCVAEKKWETLAINPSRYRYTYMATLYNILLREVRYRRNKKKPFRFPTIHHILFMFQKNWRSTATGFSSHVNI